MERHRPVHQQYNTALSAGRAVGMGMSSADPVLSCKIVSAVLQLLVGVASAREVWREGVECLGNSYLAGVIGCV